MKKFFGFAVLAAATLFVGAAEAQVVDISFNELLADPNSGSGFNFDTDMDGNFESSDEFLELFNGSGSAVDISGYQIWVGSGGVLSNRHTFATGTILNDGDFIVAINEYDPGPIPPVFVQLDTGGSGGIFGNGGDNVVLFDPTSGEYTSFIYNGDDDLFGNGLPTGATQVGATFDFGDDIDGLSYQLQADGSYFVGAPTPGAQNVPEPTSALLLGASLFGLARRRRS